MKFCRSAKFHAIFFGFGNAFGLVLGSPVIFKFKTQFQLQMRNWRLDLLANAMDLITETEIDCKSTGFPSAAGCHRALMRVAQAARAKR